MREGYICYHLKVSLWEVSSLLCCQTVCLICFVLAVRWGTIRVTVILPPGTGTFSSGIGPVTYTCSTLQHQQWPTGDRFPWPTTDRSQGPTKCTVIRPCPHLVLLSSEGLHWHDHSPGHTGQHATSPTFQPSSTPFQTFVHYISTFMHYDGTFGWSSIHFHCD